MQFLRKLALVVLVSLFSLFLFGLAADVSFVKIVTHPDKIKQILKDSGLYDSGTLVNAVLDQSKTISTSDGSISLTDPQIQAAAQKAVSPAYLQQNTETFVDSLYRWLNGKSASPDFLIDLTSAKAQFADNIASQVQTKLANLPACPVGTDPRSFNALNATCLPRGITAQTAADRVRTDIQNGKGFLDNPVLTAKNIKSANTNQSVFNDKLKDAPEAYQKAKKGPFVLAILAILTGFGIIFLSATRRLGIRKVGISMLSIGIIMLIFAWVISEASDKGIDKIKFDNATIQKEVNAVTHDIVQDVNKTYAVIGGVYIILGGAAITGSKFLFKNHRGGINGDTPATPEPPATGGGNPFDDTPARRTPRPRKVVVQ